MKIVFYNGKIVLDNCIESNKFLVVNNGIIEGIFNEMPKNVDKKYNLNGNYISHGFIDIHVHGGGGYDYNDATKEAFIKSGELHLKHGTTALMPTLVACSNEELSKCISVYENLPKSNKIPKLLGLHLEGPYISPEQSRAIDQRYIKQPKR